MDKIMKYGTISTGSIEASSAAEEILKFGGNAFDAAVSAVLVSMTSEFALTGAFGGGVLLGVENNSSPFVYDFFVDSPHKFNSQNEFSSIDVDFGSTVQSFNIGKGSIAVPGTITGLLEVHKNHGKLPLSDIIKPAIDCANHGIVLSNYQAYILSLIHPILSYNSSIKNLLFNNNELLKEGQTFKNPAFGDFLQLLSKNGADYFYKGEGLNTILNFLGNNSNLTTNDFTDYKVTKRNAIGLDFKEHTIYTNPSPSHGGTLILFLLKLIQDSSINNVDIFHLIKGMNLASLARQEVCIDPDNEHDISKILHDSIYNKHSQLFNSTNNLDFADGVNGFGSTTHVSIMDRFDNAVSITTTNGEGCGYVIPEYGIMMNNMLGEDELNPFGFHKWNKKRRLPTMVSPIIITENSKPKFVLGSGGSNRIRSANVQVILNLLIENLDLQEAISKPRIHLEGNTLFHEPLISIPENHIKNMNINSFNDKNLFFGGVNAVSKYSAVGDERRGGCGIIC